MTLTAVRTVSEDDTFHVIEGRAIPYGGPFNGRDSYGTFFSVRSDLGLEPDLPVKIWYNHGFDPDFGFSTIGRTTSVRSDEDGIWVQAQLDKRHRYYSERVKPLLEQGALGFSAGSAEHSYKLDEKSGEILTYPVHEISLTPTEANPWATIAARTAEFIKITTRSAEPDVPEVMEQPDPMAEALTAADAALGAVRALLDDPEAVRAGARHSQKDLTRINAIREHAAAITGHAGDLLSSKANDAPRDPDTREDLPATQDPSASRSADSVSVLTITRPENVAAIRAEMLEIATRTGRETAKALTG